MENSEYPRKRQDYKFYISNPLYERGYINALRFWKEHGFDFIAYDFEFTDKKLKIAEEFVVEEFYNFLMNYPMESRLLREFGEVIEKIKGRFSDLLTNKYRYDENLSASQEQDSMVTKFDDMLEAKVKSYIEDFQKSFNSSFHLEIYQKFTVAGFPGGVVIDIVDYLKKENESVDFLGNFPDIFLAFAAACYDEQKIYRLKVKNDLQQIDEQKKWPFDDSKIYFSHKGITVLKGEEDSYWSLETAEADAEGIKKFGFDNAKKWITKP